MDLSKSTNPDLDEALRFDSQAAAEKVTGKSIKTDETTQLLGLSLLRKAREQASALLLLAQDTDAFEQTAEEWLNVVLKVGFKVILEEPITRVDGAIDTKPEYFRILWFKGMLLTCDEYGGRPNSGRVYLYHRHEPGHEGFKKACAAYTACSHGPATGCEDIRDLEFDCRVALRHKLRELERAGEILETWPSERRHLWLLHHQETCVPGYDYKAINAKRIAQFPEEVRRAMGF